MGNKDENEDKKKKGPSDESHANRPRNFRYSAARKNKEFTFTDAMG